MRRDDDRYQIFRRYIDMRTKRLGVTGFSCGLSNRDEEEVFVQLPDGTTISIMFDTFDSHDERELVRVANTLIERE